MHKNAEQILSKEDYLIHVIARAKSLINKLNKGWCELKVIL